MKRSASEDSKRSIPPKRRRVALQPRQPPVAPTFLPGALVGLRVMATHSMRTDGADLRRDSFILLTHKESAMSTKELMEDMSAKVAGSDGDQSSSASLSRPPSPWKRVWLWELRELMAAFPQDNTILREVAFVTKDDHRDTRLVVNGGVTDLDWIYQIFDNVQRLFVAVESHHPDEFSRSAIRGVSSAAITLHPSVSAAQKSAPLTVLARHGIGGAENARVCILCGSAVIDASRPSKPICVVDLWTHRSNGVLMWPHQYFRASSGARSAAAAATATNTDSIMSDGSCFKPDDIVALPLRLPPFPSLVSAPQIEEVYDAVSNMPFGYQS